MERFLEKGRNCWIIQRANQVGFMVDAKEYFAAFVESVEQARQSVYIAGWDINSQIELIRDEASANRPNRLVDFLDYVVSRRPELHVYILAWDFAILYAFEREPFPIWKLRWKSHPRIHFYQDDHIPPGASHHQKIVVIDEMVAFIGGIDLTIQRWDDADHAAHDSRRIDPRGRPYKPFHDVQMVVEGTVAEHIASLYRSRWKNATGKDPKRPDRNDHAPAWPHRIQPVLKDIDVGISRTQPAYAGDPEIREVESLWKDALRAARRFIYIESPFFTSHAIGSVLEERLGHEDCPDIILVTREKCRGWLEESTMGSLRDHLLRKLHETDRYGKLRAYYPRVPFLGESNIDVHAKVLIVDNEFLRIGSSNLTNRSMGLDTECDLSIEAENDGDREVVKDFLSRLLGEHLGHEPDQVKRILTSSGSLISTIESLRGRDHTLENIRISRGLQTDLPVKQLVDPEKPIDPDELFDHYVPTEEQPSGHSRLKLFVLVLIMLIGLGILWRWSPLAEVVDVNSITALAEPLKFSPLAPVVIVACFLLGGLVVFPVTVLIAVTALLFDPFYGFINSTLGSLASAMALYLIGSLIGRDSIRRIAGRNINRISRAIAKRGIITMVVLRIIPVAPFSIINLVAGASSIRFIDYVIGTLIGMTPGILIITLFTDSLKDFFINPDIQNILILAGIAALSVVVLWMLRKHMSKRYKQ